MKLTERHHAFLVGSYYKALKENFGEEGIQIFIKATKRYAEQRGYRMALRAEAHGFKKDYLGYFTHGEWAMTPEEFDLQDTIAENGDLISKNYKCPWHTTFKEMDLLECGKVYCKYIDKHIVKGFNPELALDVTSLLHTSNCCTFYWRKANFSEETDRIMQEVSKKYGKANIMPFDYHTGHVYKTFKEVILLDLGSDGERAIKQALNSFETKYEKDVLQQVLKFENTNFDKLPE